MANGVWLRKCVFQDIRDSQKNICRKNDFTSPMRRAAKFCVGAYPNCDLASVLDPIREGPGFLVVVVLEIAKQMPKGAHGSGDCDA